MSSAHITMPILFVSHGAGPGWLMDDSGFLEGMGKESKSAHFMRNLRILGRLPRHPKAILVISAHWEEKEHTVMTSANPGLYYDYGGFPDFTYKLQWSAAGEPEVAKRILKLLQDHNIVCFEDNKRGLDHGVFIPLLLSYPEADVPVLQVSLKKNLDVSDHLKLGEALRPLRDEGVFIIGSGFTTHNTGIAPQITTADWCTQFTNWFHDALTNPAYSADERKRILLASRQAPSFSMAHPRIEHFLPSVVACAAAGYQPGTLLYNETVKGSFVLSTVKFE